MTGAAPAQRIALWRGAVAWANLDPTRGRQQSGRRPALVVASDAYLETVTTLAIVVPVTTVDRGWPNHVPLTGEPGLDRPSWAMTEQVQTIARDRLTSVAGQVDGGSLREVDVYLRDFLGF